MWRVFCVHNTKNENACSEENTKCVEDWLFDKEISVGGTTERISHQEEHGQFELKEMEMGWSEGRLSDFSNFTGWDHTAIQLWTCIILQGKGWMAPEVIQGLSGPHPRTEKMWDITQSFRGRTTQSSAELQGAELPLQWVWKPQHLAREYTLETSESDGVCHAAF